MQAGVLKRVIVGIGSGLRDMLALIGDKETAHPPPLPLSGSGLSHPGMVRSENEDTVTYCLPERSDPASRRGALAVVADGMGGHAAGEVASRIAAETVQRLYYELDGPVPAVLAKSFAAANAAIWTRSRCDPALAGMGTTCTAVAVRHNRAFLAHVGDSRAYLLREARVHQISEDHSLVGQLVRDGTLSREEARRSGQRNVILRALGTNPEVQPEIWFEGLILRPGDRLVLCSDGLSDLVDEATIAEVVTEQLPEQACEVLVSKALLAGGHDNVSIVVFCVGYPAVVGDTARPVEGDALS